MNNNRTTLTTWSRTAGVLTGLSMLAGSSMSFAQESEPPVEESPVEEAACPVEHPQVSLLDGVCLIGDGQQDGPNAVSITEDLILEAGQYVLTDQVSVGVDGETDTLLLLAGGVTLQGEAQSFLSIQRGSSLFATGTSKNPVVLTSAQPASLRAAGDWGGLTLNGFASLNVAGGQAEGEAGTGSYGGSSDEDSSGFLQHLVVEFGGSAVDSENELNGISFQGVGRGTYVDHIHVRDNGDDGVEFFGGTVNVSNLLSTGNQDDSIDWTQGFRGTLEQVTVVQTAGGNNGIEADGLSADPTALPFSNPTLRNLTLIGAGVPGSVGALFRRGTRVTVDGALISGFPVCLAVDGEDSTDAVLNGETVMDNVVVNCPLVSEEGDVAVQALLSSASVRSIFAPTLSAEGNLN